MRSKGSGARLLLLLVTILASAVTLGAAGRHQILWGRCYSYCLKKYIGDPASGLHGDRPPLPKHGIRTCQRDSTCKWCLYVCERSEHNFSDSASCLRDCENTRTRPESAARAACIDSCGFVVRSSGSKAGDCPPPGTLHGFDSACVNSCRADSECPNAEKCCRNGCGNVCTQPYFADVLPPVPTNITFKLLKTGGVLVKWTVPRPHVAGRDATWPTLYILRWWCPYTSGALTSITDKARTKLQGYPTGIYPGTKCHFMVASVNVHGSRGFSRVSPYVKKFLMPSPPLHLDKADSRLRDGRVDVTIQWQPPVYTDGLPIHRYQVFWSDSLPRASPNYMRLHMHKRTVTADQTSFVLHSLFPGTIYFVQVRAVVKWKGQNKRGRPASTYIETYAPPKPAGTNGKDAGAVYFGDGEQSAIDRINVDQSYLHHSVLKANITWTLKPGYRARKFLIYWKAQACSGHGQPGHRKTRDRIEKSATTHDQVFTLYNLEHQCEYAVRVHPVNHRGSTGPPIVTSFQTPACHVTQVVAGREPECDDTEPPGQVRELISETTDCVTVVRWQSVEAGVGVGGGREVEGYSVMWGESDAARFSASTVVYSGTPHQLTLSPDQTSLTLGRLIPRQHYTVQVTARSSGGEGQPSVLHFTVPRPFAPCPPLRSHESEEIDVGKIVTQTPAPRRTTTDHVTNRPEERAQDTTVSGRRAGGDDDSSDDRGEKKKSRQELTSDRDTDIIDVTAVREAKDVTTTPVTPPSATVSTTAAATTTTVETSKTKTQSSDGDLGLEVSPPSSSKEYNFTHNNTQTAKTDVDGVTKKKVTHVDVTNVNVTGVSDVNEVNTPFVVSVHTQSTTKRTTAKTGHRGTSSGSATALQTSVFLTVFVTLTSIIFLDLT